MKFRYEIYKSLRPFLYTEKKSNNIRAEKKVNNRRIFHYKIFHDERQGDEMGNEIGGGMYNNKKKKRFLKVTAFNTETEIT